MLIRFIIFLILNFTALGLGGLVTGDAVASDWYINLNKAPWTPPGWVFGFAWSSIMIYFSWFMAKATWQEPYDDADEKKKILFLFGLQWILNVVWNPVFFAFHKLFLALILIIALLFVVSYLYFLVKKKITWHALAILPYMIWLVIATSLNAYAWLYN